MDNKGLITKLRDNSELAWAAYGYFHLANPRYDFNKDNIDKERLEYFRKLYKNNNLESSKTDEQLQSIYPTPADILNIEYKYFKDNNGKPKDSWYHKYFLGGEFSPLQAKQFFSRYDLLKHCPNTGSGFSATLSYEKTERIKRN
ncbi:hypothetical protein IZI86_01650 [Campylobacter coli]|uniref:hypothetical protein n=1 Tax=Campylobacter coli TaxID=195 RepID=UPI0008755247|nr:hypothetical protein [Campylobacter coli]EAI5486697.1 hypothetical protein [Campylobacter coli]EAJ4299553.1 hypothetical protein [Campylobacter coli]EAJ8089187.1 hypothetical protein [Campylobacter coli]EAK0539522.1 hypothetical protein [Campylobacter coli]EAK5691943.1 hypothetical protein [Campylobacter coli]